jgi:hypothetical protein
MYTIIGSLIKLRSCVTHTMQQCNFNNEKCNYQCNSNVTISLKALADKVLKRNWQRNSNATNGKNQCKLLPIKEPKNLHEQKVFMKIIIEPRNSALWIFLPLGGQSAKKIDFSPPL